MRKIVLARHWGALVKNIVLCKKARAIKLNFLDRQKFNKNKDSELLFKKKTNIFTRMEPDFPIISFSSLTFRNWISIKTQNIKNILFRKSDIF